MNSNSQIFTNTIYGNSSSLTKEELVDKQSATVEKYLNQFEVTTMRTRMPVLPSNQQIAKDK